VGVLRKLDGIYYGSEGFGSIAEKEYFELVQSALVESVEAYHSLSSVLIVVYGLQAGMDLVELGVLGRKMKLVSAYENLLMFQNGTSDADADEAT
jgi:hypothetical protein